MYCPGNQVNETNKPDFRVFWNEPTYTDNCQDNSSCQIKIRSNLASGSKFNIHSSPYTVRYTAKDPSGNVNEECTFKVTIKKKIGNSSVFKFIPKNLSESDNLMFFV